MWYGLLYFQKNMLGYNMSFHSYRVVFCAPIPTGPRTPDFGSGSMSYSLLTAQGRYSGLSGPVYRLTGLSAR